jgi:hypothetical protein
MRNLIAFLIASQIFSPVAFAGNSSTRRIQAKTTNGFLSNENILSDGGFENGGTGWTASGGSYSPTTSTAANVERGSKAGDWDSSAAAQTLVSETIAIPAGMYGRNGVVSCAFKAASGTATHTLTANDGTNDLVTGQTIASSTSSYQRTSVNFIFPSSGNIKVKIASVASNEPEVFIDGCYLGLAEGFNLSQVSQARQVGRAVWAPAASCSYPFNGAAILTNWNEAAVDTDCNNPTVTGSAKIPGTKVPQLQFDSLGAGKYYFVMNGILSTASGTGFGIMSCTDGTTEGTARIFYSTSDNHNTGATLVCEFDYSTAQGATNFRPMAQSASGAWVGALYNGENTQDESALSMSLYYYPSGSDTAFRSETAAFIWSGYHDANCDFTTTSGSYVLPSRGSNCTFTETNNVNAGTVVSQTSGGFTAPGLVWTPNSTGKYEVCAEFTAYDDTAAATVNAMLYDSVAGNGPTQNYRAPVSGGYVAPFSLCRILDVASTASRTTELHAAVGAGTGHITAIGFTGDRAITWSIKKLTQNVPAPVIVNSITSNSAGGERIERARIDNTAGAGTITSQSGSWVTRNTSSTGDVTLDITSGLFSAAPTCTCSVESDNTTTVCIQATTPSTTQLRFRTYRSATGSDVLGNKAFDIICMGPR